MDTRKDSSGLKSGAADLQSPLSGALQVRDISVSPPVMLAPMSGITDRPMRLVCRGQGSPLASTEMIAAAALARGKLNPDALEAIKTHPRDRPLVMQIIGSDPDEMAEAARILSLLADAIDINMGCPAKKVIKSGSGAALMRDPEKAALLVRAVRRSTHLPLTVKTRTGWDEASRNVAELARMCEREGADAIVVHARTKARAFAGPPDLEGLREAVDAVNIPVIGNGGITGPADARAMIERTGCAGVMVARSARGNPWIFRELAQGPGDPPTAREKAQTVMAHLDMMLEHMPEHRAVVQMRKHLSWYSKGLPAAVELRKELPVIETAQQARELVRAYFVDPEDRARE